MAEEVKKKTEAAKTEAPKAEAPKAKAEKRVRRTVPQAHVYISATYNNTLMTMTDLNGAVLAATSAGANNFKGSRKATPYAATITAEKLIEKASAYGVQSVKVFVSGVGVGREQAVRGLQAAGLELTGIFDTTPMPHNGCRCRKSRRV